MTILACVALPAVAARVAGAQEQLAYSDRAPMYYGQTGKVTVSRDEPAPDCYYCKAVRGRHDRADVQRYLRASVGSFLR
jgi:hypothetical protein